MEITTSWKEEGRAEGREEGRREATLQVALRLLGQRLGAVPEASTDLVRALPSTDLEALVDALLEFRTVADLEDWLATPR